MKHLTLSLVILIIIGMFSACQESTIHEDDDDRKSPAFENILFPSSPEESDPTIPSIFIPQYTYALEGGSQFRDGVAFVRCSRDDESTFLAAIDTSGRILYRLPDGWETYECGFNYGIIVDDNLIYDINLNIIASPELSGYDELLTGNCDGYILAKKTEESYQGDKVYIGVLDHNGEWAYPLSTDNPVVKHYEELGENPKNIKVGSYDDMKNAIIPIRHGSIGWDEFYYNMATNEVTVGYEYYESWNYQGKPVGIHQHTTSGEVELLVPNVTSSHLFDDVFVGRDMELLDGYRLYDYEGSVLLDLTQYDILKVKDYFNGHLLFTFDNGSGSEYLCLLDANGSFVFEPIRFERKDGCYALDEYGFVFHDHIDDEDRSVYKFYDYSGNMTEIMPLEYFNGFREGFALVQTSEGVWCYINTHGEIVINSIME